jgi:N-methylhydantoinase B
MSPGGNSPGATEVFHEGVRIPGIKLIERGKLRRDVFEAITNMTRNPEMVGLDLKCEIAANSVARARIQEMCDQYGADLVDAVSNEMIRYSEQVLRKRLLEIPDGRWSAKGTIQTSDTWNVTVTLTKSGDHLLFDFTGTDPQAKVGINLPYHATFGACFQGLLTLLGWDIPKNHGAFAPIEVIAPPGTLVNVQSPGPVSLSTTAGGPVVKYVADAVLTQMVAASARWGTEVYAKNTGHRRARHAGTNQYGWYYVSAFGGLDGGGARAALDGVDSGGAGLMTDHNVEWFESHFPFLYLFRRHITDAGGAGKLRGGVGEEVALTLHEAPEGQIKGVAYGVAGLRNSGRGLFGGFPGAPSVIVHHRDTRVRQIFGGSEAPVDRDALGGEAIALPYCEFQIGEQDVLYISNASGGGFGDPLDRDPALVASDVSETLVSPEAAREIYGVVLRAGVVDVEATELMRGRLREERREGLERTGADAGRPVGAGVPEHPLRENLEVARHAGALWIQCARCRHVLCEEAEDWTRACDRKLLAPTRGGALMEPLEGHFFLEQLSCPSCAVLFDTEVVEAS